MSILTMFNVGLQGLRAHRQAMNVTGDNIANMNTVGFKGARVTFRDMLNSSSFGSTSGSGAAIGGGVEVGSVQRLFDQGSITSGQSALDFAIAGDGFFVVNGDFGGRSGEFYTRAGQFRIDQTGFIVNDLGMRLQAFPFDANQSISNTPSDLQIPQGTMPPLATTSLTLSANLSADQEVGPAFDVTDIDNTTDHAASLKVFDSLGASHDVTVYFTRVTVPAPGWTWNAVTDGGELDGGTDGEPTLIGSGTMTFTANGALNTLTPDPPQITASFADGAAANQQMQIDFGDDIGGGGTGLTGMSQFGSDSSTKVTTQDGYPPGELENLELGDGGILFGFYSNGEQRNIGQLALAQFSAKEGLAKAGGNLYTASRQSGQVVIDTAKGASVIGGALEQSNVDVAEQFVALIREQRAFSASSRTITTADEVFSETINLKR